ncbi:BON domain-containing protein [Rhizobacter sp. Root404]|uniref:BON domain-containing protein n=1 Tax=Rhizobacter sp. Root404 TaxID=1736528 RepID=UPI0006FDFF51|nr:BON domain-containing protein [Rhizobacter sp. Root404]KQW37652.1 OsmY domain-containing protein [Rhizobacter sp. Root404]
MKTDAEIKRDITGELAWDPEINAEHVGVSVGDGVATISGHVDTHAERHAILRAVQRIPDVKACALELDVRLAPGHQRNDTDIARDAEHALRCNAAIPADAIALTVDQGCVVLRGEVEWQFQRRAAETAIRPLIGVVSVSNEIALRPRANETAISTRIEKALTRQAIRESRRIRVSVDGGTVRLTGNVHSWQEREAAQGVAWKAPGVRAVIDELTVG